MNSLKWLDAEAGSETNAFYHPIGLPRTGIVQFGSLDLPRRPALFFNGYCFFRLPRFLPGSFRLASAFFCFTPPRDLNRKASCSSSRPKRRKSS